VFKYNTNYVICKFLGDMLVNESIVGSDCSNFNWESNSTVSSGRVSDGKFFRNAEKAIHDTFGQDCYCITIILSHDKTEVSARSAWPISLSCGNFSTKVLMSDRGNKLVGFVPNLPCNDERLRTYLRQAGVSTKANRKKAITLLHSYSEHKYLLGLIEPILEIQQKGPIWLRVGGNNSCYQIRKCMVRLAYFPG